MVNFKTGIGYDVHRLVEGRPLIIGGVSIPYEKGLLGHSDADVLCHAIGDALLGALALGDLGKHFPDTDPQFKGMNSLKILEEIRMKMEERKYQISNIDSVIIAEAPKLSPFRNEMKENISKALKIELDQLNIKATTEEGLGFTGLGQGIAAWASVIICH